MPSEEPRPCQQCGKPCTTRCGQCRALYFCCKDCQIELWKFHKSFCKAVSKPTLAVADNPSSKRCLLVDGLGPCSPGFDDVVGSKRELVKAGVDVATVDASRGKIHFAGQVASLLQTCDSTFYPTTVILMGWGSGNIPEDWNDHTPFRTALQDWCRAGGNLIVQGERMQYCGNWPSWFDKSWKDGSYYRTDHKCSERHWCEWLKSKCAGAIPTYNVKACMIQNVEPEDALYGVVDGATSYSLVPGFGGASIEAGSVAIACGRFGEGTVSFFGDVNAEKETHEIMAMVARGQ